MSKKSVIFALALVAISSTAWAQTKVQVSGLFGYTLSDGVSGDAFFPGDGNSYNRVDPKDGGNFGFSVGFMVNPNAEVGFMYRRQMSKAVISGSATKELGDLNVDGYHGYFTYYFGDPEGKVNPYFLGGFGATNIPATTLTNAVGATVEKNGGTEFSSTWGAGIRFNAATHFAIKAGVSWTPTYIKSDPSGYWCDPWWGCYVVGNAQYMNQFHFEGAVVIRF
jgi:opacity protein-like surface antigen